MDQMDIRTALPSDADDVFRLLSKFAMSYESLRSAFDASYPRLLESSGADPLVAERGGRVVGYVLAGDSLTLFANGVVTELLELYVDEPQREGGIGRGLVNQPGQEAGVRWM